MTRYSMTMREMREKMGHRMAELYGVTTEFRVMPGSGEWVSHDDMWDQLATWAEKPIMGAPALTISKRITVKGQGPDQEWRSGQPEECDHEWVTARDGDDETARDETGRIWVHCGICGQRKQALLRPSVANTTAQEPATDE